MLTVTTSIWVVTDGDWAVVASIWAVTCAVLADSVTWGLPHTSCLAVVGPVWAVEGSICDAHALCRLLNPLCMLLNPICVLHSHYVGYFILFELQAPCGQLHPLCMMRRQCIGCCMRSAGCYRFHVGCCIIHVGCYSIHACCTWAMWDVASSTHSAHALCEISHSLCGLSHPLCILCRLCVVYCILYVCCYWRKKGKCREWRQGIKIGNEDGEPRWGAKTKKPKLWWKTENKKRRRRRKKKNFYPVSETASLLKKRFPGIKKEKELKWKKIYSVSETAVSKIYVDPRT